jgi:MoaA/NifB/PqqE/SkfB family radical SAM enzyme
MGLHELWVSVDGTDAATFEKIRGSKLFDRVLHNIRTLTRLRKELGSQRPRVALNFVAQRSNIEQLPRFVRMAKELGADAVNVGFLQVYSRELLAESLYFYQELSDACMAEAQRAAQEVRIELYIPGFFHERGDAATVSRSADVAPSAEPIKCVEPYGFVLVHADGSLGPCCVNDSRLGSLSTHDFVALWNGELYADFRRRVSTPEQDFDCEHCMLEGYKDIHEFEHHAKLFDENYRRAEVDYAALEQEVREQIAQGG